MRFFSVFCLLVLLLAPAGHSQTDSAALSSESVSDELGRLQAELQSATDLDEALRTQIDVALKDASQSESRLEELRALITAQQQLPDVSAKKTVLMDQLNELKESDPSTRQLPENADELARSLTATREQVDLLKKNLADAETAANRRTSRREEIRTRQLAIEAELPQLDAQLASLQENDLSLANRANALRLKSRKRNLELEKELLKSEISRFDAEESEGVLALERELYRERLARQQALLTRLENARSEREKKAAMQAAAEAKKQQESVEERNPLLVPSYEINTDLAQQNQKWVERSAEINSELSKLRKKLETIQKQFAETETMVEQVGLSGSVGDLLRQRKSELPSPQVNQIRANETKQEVDQIQFQLFDITRRQTDLTKETIEKEILAANEGVKPADLQGLSDEIEELLTARRDILDASKRNVRELFESLVDMEYRYRTYANVIRDYRNFLNERIFWIRSNDVLFSELTIDPSDWKLFEYQSWANASISFSQLVAKTPLPFALLLSLFMGLIVLRPKFRAEIKNTGQLAGKGSCDSFWPTLRALFSTFLLSLLTPLLLIGVGFAIQQSPVNDGRSLLAAIGYAMLAAGLFALPIEFLRHLCRDNGLGQKHFYWSNASVSILKQNLRWFGPVGLGIVFVIALLQRLDVSHRVDLLERVCFVAGMTFIFIFLRQTLSPAHGIFHDYLKKHERSWFNQTSTLWFGAILSLPVLLAVLTILGYYYTASSLMYFAFATIAFVVVVETLRSLLLRFILMQRRHVHIEAAKRKREAERELRKKQAAQAKKDSADATVPGLPEVSSESDPVVDIDENAIEAKKLVGLGTWFVWAFGLWIIWADVLPALKALDKQPIFPSQLLEDEKPAVEVARATSTESGGSDEAQPSPLDPMGIAPAESSSSTSESSATNDLSAVTYGDLLLCLLILAIMIAAARSLPGTMEMIFLNQLPVDRSVRYAIKSLVSYVIVLVGMVLAFRALSISWSNVQWLATALTFGLAFGLQEIFANFVAGIILMFERPMRIGDWITIDDFTGMVTKIRTRATTIVNLDRKEYVIPNKDFITGRLVNWTLSDAINRIEIHVGVAYGSDVRKARELMLKVCEDHPKIVNDPPTSATFQSFGDNSLNLVLRAFLRDIDSRLPTINELHTRINDAFNQAGIEISFPQRDLHLRSIDPRIQQVLRESVAPARQENVETAD